MIKCRHTDCNHTYGWTHRGGESNEFMGDELGEFFYLETENFTKVQPTRFHGEVDGLELRGCPKCFRLSLTKEEYLDD